MVKHPFGMTVLVTLLGASTAHAQPPEWTLKVKYGQSIFLTTQSGERVEGAAGDITPDGILVASPLGVKTVPYRDLRRAEKRDPRWTGAAIGAGVGVAIGLASIAGDDRDCPKCAADRNAVPIGSAIYGALIGWGIDALVKGTTTLYDRERQVNVALIPHAVGAAAAITLRW